MPKSPTSTLVPQQKRAIDTYEKLLTATGKLLPEVGFERISTNMIAERAGVSPPTVYRYFKDKYDVLAALGQRLMDTQNELLDDLGEKLLTDPDFVLTSSYIAAVNLETVNVTESFVGGTYMMKCLRVVSGLSHIRTDSHEKVSRQLAKAAMTFAPHLKEGEIYRQTRLSIEIGYSAIELVLEDKSLDRKATLRDAAVAIAAFNDAVQL